MGVVVGVLFGVAGIYWGVQKMFLAKDAEHDQRRIRLSNDFAKLQRENTRIESTAKSLKGWASLTYDLDELRASAKLGATLVALVERAGLNPEKLSLQPVRGGRVRGAYREIGRTLRVRGRLQNIVDFLYLLRKEPHLHRLDNLSITPLPKTNEIDVQVRYVALVLDAKASEKLQTDMLPTTAPTDLDSDERKLYDAIASRDLFRPYIQRRQAPPPPRPTPTPPRPSPRRPTPTPPRPAPTPTPNPGRFRVVGLPDWSDKQEVLVSDSSTGQLRTYKAGDTLAGGTIVMVDYRLLPSPKNPQILSPSRAILRVGPDYWAVDLGSMLTEKRRLKADQLPDTIRSLPNDAPGDKVKKTPPAER